MREQTGVDGDQAAVHFVNVNVRADEKASDLLISLTGKEKI